MSRGFDLRLAGLANRGSVTAAGLQTTAISARMCRTVLSSLGPQKAWLGRLYNVKRSNETVA